MTVWLAHGLNYTNVEGGQHPQPRPAHNPFNTIEPLDQTGNWNRNNKLWTIAALTNSNYSLGKHLLESTNCFGNHGWDVTVHCFQTPVNFPHNISKLPYQAARFLNCLCYRGPPIAMTTPHWIPSEQLAAITKGPHQSAILPWEFLEEEMARMTMGGKWLLLPFQVVQNQPGFQISPIRVGLQHDKQPRTIVDYTFHLVDQETLQLLPKEAIQLGKALSCPLAKVVQADIHYGPVHMVKEDIANGFYQVHLCPYQIPPLGLLGKV